MLSQLQRQLSEINQADHGYDVHDFLITDPVLAKAIGGSGIRANSGESLLVCDDGDGIAMSLFLEGEMLDRLESSDPLTKLEPCQLNDLCKVIEGLSHFNYVAWCAASDRSVTLLELEIQAEVDKYVSTVQLALQQQATKLLNGLHRRLFDNIQFDADLDDEQAERYRAASDFAARFCRNIRQRLLSKDQNSLQEVRHFFRLPLGEKISHIHTQAW